MDTASGRNFVSSNFPAWIFDLNKGAVRTQSCYPKLFFQLPSLYHCVFAQDVAAWHAAFVNKLEGSTHLHSAEVCHQKAPIMTSVSQDSLHSFW